MFTVNTTPLLSEINTHSFRTGTQYLDILISGYLFIYPVSSQGRVTVILVIWKYTQSFSYFGTTDLAACLAMGLVSVGERAGGIERTR